MGNRAVITMDKKVGVYLHWNGGKDSVKAFLKYCELKGYRAYDETYGLARLTQVIANFFGGSTSIGVGSYSSLDTNNFDNGVYVIKDWKIVDREYFEGTEQDEYNIFEMLKSIDVAQPLNERLFKGKRKITEKDLKEVKQ